MQVSIGKGISIHINMNMIIGICRSFNVNIRIGIVHSRIRNNISVNAGINTGISLSTFNKLSMSVLILVIA